MEPSATPPLPVVCALIEDEGCILVALRAEGRHLAGHWEFPGGKVEPGEDPVAALAREIREELGCDLDIGDPLPAHDHAYPQRTVRLLPYLARLRPGGPPPRPVEHAQIRFVAPSELRTLTLAPADLPLVEDYLRLRASGR